MKILFVCLGNICRSPLAEGAMKHLASSRGLSWTVDSAGTGAYHQGNPPDPRSIRTARENGVDIASQRARQVVPGDFARFDHIFAMDRENLDDLRAQCPKDHRNKLRLLREFDTVGGDDVPDPYYRRQGGFEDVWAMIYRSCQAFIDDVEGR